MKKEKNPLHVFPVKNHNHILNRSVGVPSVCGIEFSFAKWDAVFNSKGLAVFKEIRRVCFRVGLLTEASSICL